MPVIQYFKKISAYFFFLGVCTSPTKSKNCLHDLLFFVCVIQCSAEMKYLQNTVKSLPDKFFLV